MRGAAAGLVLLLLAALPARADFAAGARAYDGGDYTAAFAAWQRLAEAGDVMAQVAIAGLYRRGLGRAPNAAAALGWHRRAALAGDAVAQLNLGEMLTRGDGAPRDIVMGWVWLSRAAAQGNGWARDKARRLAELMTPAQRAAARQRLR